MTDIEYQKTLKKVMDYAIEKSPMAKTCSDIGAMVTLSDWGIKMQGKDKRKKSGIVLEWHQWMHFPNDGTVIVKWDGMSKPDSMHISQVKLLNK